MAAAAQALTEQTRSLFGDDFGEAIDITSDIPPISTSYKRKVEYERVRDLPKALAEKQAKAAASRGPKRPKVQAGGSNQLALVKSEGKQMATRRQHRRVMGLETVWYADRTCSRHGQSGTRRGS